MYGKGVLGAIREGVSIKLQGKESGRAHRSPVSSALPPSSHLPHPRSLPGLRCRGRKDRRGSMGAGRKAGRAGNWEEGEG